MKKVMFTKHLTGYDVKRIIKSLKHIELDGADLCTRRRSFSAVQPAWAAGTLSGGR